MSDQPNVPAHHLEFARREQAASAVMGRNLSIAEILERNGLATRTREHDGLTRQELQIYVPATEQAALGICLLDLRNGVLRIAAEGPVQQADLTRIEQAVRTAGVALRKSVVEPWDRQRMLKFQKENADIAGDRLVRILSDLQRDTDDGSLIDHAVRDMLDDALQNRASDLHLEQYDDDDGACWLSYRIDGDLERLHLVPARVMAPLIVRIKTLAGVDAAERSVPQDGRFAHAWQGRQIDVRVATAPLSPPGQEATLRLLDRANLQPLHRLLDGMPMVHARVRAALDLPIKDSGLILVTGPTGSGKSTTLYAMAMTIDRVRKKVRSVEAPAEYRMPLVSQVSLDERSTASMGQILRSFMRLDPDFIIVGESRDTDTVTTALRAVESSHTVLSTLHSEDTINSLERFIAFLPPHDRDWGVGIIASSLKGVLNQRLIKRVCPSCGVGGTAAKDIPELLNVLPGIEAGTPVVTARAGGCRVCRGTGHVGRELVLEALFIPPDLGVRREIASMLGHGKAFSLPHLPGVVHIPRAASLERLVIAGRVDPRSAVAIMGGTFDDLDHLGGGE